MVDEDAPDSLQVRWWPMPPGRWGVSVQTQGGRELTEGLDLSGITGIEAPTARTGFGDEDQNRVVREASGDRVLLESSGDSGTTYIYEKVDGRYLMVDIDESNETTRQSIDRIRS